MDDDGNDRNLCSSLREFEEPESNLVLNSGKKEDNQDEYGGFGKRNEASPKRDSLPACRAIR
jgi:hypothetical protein